MFSYSEWLLTQPEAFQDELLGSQGENFRNGKYVVTKFEDLNYGAISLEELEELDNKYNLED